MKKKVTIMEVGPRDGWQNLIEFIPTDRKLYYIEKMLSAGISAIQLGSFVHPKAIPQLRDIQEVLNYILPRYPERHFNVLVPNLYGAKAAWENGLKEVCYVISVSESHNMANINRTPEQSFSELAEIRSTFPKLEISLACATAFGCPFEGETPKEKVLSFVEKGLSLNIKKFEIADTIGIAYPTQVKELFCSLNTLFPEIQLTAHFHDTRNMGILNSWIALQEGAEVIQTCLGGLGGCPFAPGATGNTATEDLVYTLEKSGYDTGADVSTLIQTAKEMRQEIPGQYSGHQVMIGV